MLKFLALICVLTALASFAQTEGARISGRVTDLRGAVIVGAQCTITNIETDVSTVTATNEDGIYVIPDLHPATYRLTIEKEGFRTVVQPTLQLSSRMRSTRISPSRSVRHQKVSPFSATLSVCEPTPLPSALWWTTNSCRTRR